MLDAFSSWLVSNVVLAALLAVLAFLGSRLSRNPHLAHFLWLLVLIKLITPPIVTIDFPWPRQTTEHRDAPKPATPIEPLPVSNSPVKLVDAEPAPALPPAGEMPPAPLPIPTDPLPIPVEPRAQVPPVAETSWWSLGILLAWGLGTVVCLGLLMFRCRRFRGLLSLAVPAEKQTVDQAVHLAKHMGLLRCPAILLIEAPIPPLVWGVWGSPQILLPRNLFVELSPEEQRTVLAHELAHVRRGDHRLRWIEVVVHLLFWWYPIAWWATRAMRLAEEECCDAWVIWAVPESRQCYGQALCKTVEFLTETQLAVPQAVGGTMGSHYLKRRIEMIVNRQVNHRMSWKVRIPLLLLAALALPLAAQTTIPELPETKPQTETTTPDQEAQPSILTDGQKSKPRLPEPTPLNAADSPGTLPVNVDETGGISNPRTTEGKSYSAHLVPSTDVRISTSHAGLVEDVQVVEGTRVKKGQLVAKIRNHEMETSLEFARGGLKVQQEKYRTAEVDIQLAESAVNAASAELKRTERAAKMAAVSESELRKVRFVFERAQFTLKKAESEAKTAAIELSILERRAQLATQLQDGLAIRSPVDGIVLELRAKFGEILKSNDAVCRVVSLNPLIAEFHVGDARGLRGKPVIVRVHVTKTESHKFPGKVTFVSPLVDPVSGTFRIRCEFENKGLDGEPLVHPGRRATVIIPNRK